MNTTFYTRSKINELIEDYRITKNNGYMMKFKPFLDHLDSDLKHDEKFIYFVNRLSHGDNILLIFISNYGKFLSIGRESNCAFMWDTAYYKDYEFVIPTETLYMLKMIAGACHNDSYQICLSIGGGRRASSASLIFQSYIKALLDALQEIKKNLEDDVCPPPDYEDCCYEP